MRDYQTKSNVGALPDTITATRFGSGEFNSIATELENAVSTSDQSLAPADGTGEVSDQLAKSLAIYGAGGASYHVDTGAVNAYVLSPVSPKESPPAYFDGFIVIFSPTTDNSTASTVNVGSLGIKSITLPNGNALSGGELSGICAIKFNLSDDRFELMFSSGGFAGVDAVFIVDSTQADQGATSSNPDTLTIFDVAALVGTATNATIRLIHNPTAGNVTNYVFDTSLDLTTYPLIRFQIDQGAQFSRTTGDEVLTLFRPQTLMAGQEQIITTADMISFASQGEASARWWGALFDGSTDDTAAINYALASGAGIVYLPSGTAIIESIFLQTDTKLIGQGKGITTLKSKDNSAAGQPVQAISKNNFTIAHLSIDGNSANQINFDHNVYIFEGYSVLLDNIESYDAYYDGLYYQNGQDETNRTTSKIINSVFRDNGAEGIGHINGWNITYENNNFENNVGVGLLVFNGVEPVVPDESVNVSIINNRIGYNSDGMQVSGFLSFSHDDNAHRAFVIANNHVIGNTQWGLVFQGVNASIVGNQITENGTNGAHAGLLANCNASTIVGNTITKNAGYGIDAGGAWYTVICNNIVSENFNNIGNFGIGINVGGSIWCKVIGNVCSENNGSSGGIQINAGYWESSSTTDALLTFCDHLTISNNLVYSTQASAHGIYVYGGPSNVKVSDNDITNVDANLACIVESESCIISQNTINNYGIYTIASASTVVVPDGIEDVIFSGSTNIDELQTYTYNNFIEKVWKCTVTNGGSGYTSNPTVSFSGGGGAGAAGIARIFDGEVIVIEMTNHGSGYTSAPTVSFSGGGGAGAVATAQVGCNNIDNKNLLLLFSAGLTLANGGTPVKRLAGAANFVATANDIIELRGTLGQWFEKNRSVN